MAGSDRTGRTAGRQGEEATPSSSRDKLRLATAAWVRRAGRSLIGWGWRAAFWMVAALLSSTVVVVIAQQVIPVAVSLAGQSVSLQGASGATAGLLGGVALLEIAVVTGFACWAGVVVIRAIWRWRRRVLGKLLGEAAPSDADDGTAGPAIATSRRGHRTVTAATNKAREAVK